MAGKEALTTWPPEPKGVDQGMNGLGKLTAAIFLAPIMFGAFVTGISKDGD